MNDKEKAQVFFQGLQTRLDTVYDTALGALDSTIAAVDGYLDRLEAAVLAKMDEKDDGYPDTYAMCADIGRSNEEGKNFTSAWTKAAQMRTGFDADTQRDMVKSRWDNLDARFKQAK